MPLRQYRCYFTDEADRINAVQIVESADDATAMLRAEELLATSKHRTAELWQGPRLVGKWSGPNGAVDPARRSQPEQPALDHDIPSEAP